MFKVGDKVKIINPYSQDEGYRGDVVTISRVDDDDSDRFFVKENCRPWRSSEVELVKEYKMTKKDLKTGDIVTLKNGDKLGLLEEDFCNLSGGSHWIDDLSDYNDDLTCDNRCYSEYDIIKVERPTEYETVYTRDDTVELTVDEISEKLGYKVKIVGEDR